MMNKNQAKTIHNLTIKEYSLFEETGDIEYLVKLPITKNCNVDISGLLQKINIELHVENENTKKLQKELYKIKSQYRIQLLITLYEAAYNLMVMQTDLNNWKILIGKEPTKLTNLMNYVEKIKENTGIEIKKPEDLIKLKKEIEECANKYAENFPLIDPNPENLTFMQIVLGVFSAMNLNLNLNYEMYMSDFFDLKNQVEQMSKHL